MKIIVKVKKRIVRYWDIVFLNYRGEQMLYTVVAPNKESALKSFERYMGSAEYRVLSVSSDGEDYVLL